MYIELETMLNRKNQRLVCCDNEWPVPGPHRHIAYIRHDVEPPVDAQTLDDIRKQVGDLPEILAFYQRYGSVRLYADTIGDGSAFFIAPPADWAGLKECFTGWIEHLDEDERSECLPEWIDDCLVIGEVPQSGNYFLLPLMGADRGKIIEFEHDGFEFIERGPNMAVFMATLCTVTKELLNEILGHTRYWDGQTGIQWLCEEYHYDEPPVEG